MNERKNPYDIIDYEGNHQEELPYSYQKFLSHMAALVEAYKVDYPAEFWELKSASKELFEILPKFKYTSGKHGWSERKMPDGAVVENGRVSQVNEEFLRQHHKDPISSYVRYFMINNDLPNFWLNASNEVRVVLGAMLVLHHKGEGRVMFGEKAVRDYVRSNGLSEILADKYMDFYEEMIKKRVKNRAIYGS